MLNLFKKKPEKGLIVVPHSSNYRGYKRLKLTTYKDKESIAGNKTASKLTDIREISFKETSDADGLIVYADGLKVGTIWKTSWEDYYKQIVKSNIESAHLEPGEDSYLFIKIKQK